MTEPPLEKLNVLDTQYVDILVNSLNPTFELQLIQFGVDPAEAKSKTRFITLLQHQPETLEEWETLMDAWEEVCGYRPNVEHLSLVSQLLWDSDREVDEEDTE